MEKQQYIYIYMDDSGKVNKNESSCVFAGIFFYDKKAANSFINKYKATINKIKCDYCHKKCNNLCPEIKGNMRLKKKHRKKLIQLINSQISFAVFINNKNIYKSIMNNKLSRGRFIEYAQKRIIKEVLLYSIKNKKINSKLPITIYLNIDEDTTKSNGYYDLKQGIYEVLIHGTININKLYYFKPVLKRIALYLTRYDSKYNYGIEAADMLANYLHHQYERNIKTNHDITKTLKSINIIIYLP